MRRYESWTHPAVVAAVGHRDRRRGHRGDVGRRRHRLRGVRRGRGRQRPWSEHRRQGHRAAAGRRDRPLLSGQEAPRCSAARRMKARGMNPIEPGEGVDDDRRRRGTSTTISTQPIGASASFEPELSMPATAMRPPKTPSTISAPTAVSTGNPRASGRRATRATTTCPDTTNVGSCPPISPSRVDHYLEARQMLARPEALHDHTWRCARTGQPHGRPHRLQRRLLPADGDRPRMPRHGHARRRRPAIRAPLGAARRPVDVARRRHHRTGDGRTSLGRFVAGAVRAVRDRGATAVPAVDLAVSSTVPVGLGAVVELGAGGRAHARARRARRASPRRARRRRARRARRPRSRPPACPAGSWTSSPRCSDAPGTRC